MQSLISRLMLAVALLGSASMAYASLPSSNAVTAAASDPTSPHQAPDAFGDSGSWTIGIGFDVLLRCVRGSDGGEHHIGMRRASMWCWLIG